MATTCMRNAGLHKQQSDDSVPPGFASLMTFTLERVPDDCAMTSTSCSSDAQRSQMRSVCHGLNVDKCKELVQREAWMKYGNINESSEEASKSEMADNDILFINPLVKGVLRGCADCANCLKVNARWRPEDGRRPILDEAPVFYPNEEEFRDTLKYVATIKSVAEQYGICRIVPPLSWKPPCPLKENAVWERRRFSTCIQHVDKLQNHCSARQVDRYCRPPNKKKRKLLEFGDHHLQNSEHRFKYDEMGCNNFSERFGFESGPEFTLKAFQDYADYFEEQYFCAEDRTPCDRFDQNNIRSMYKPSLESIEGEYWRIVEKPTEAIEVLYGADIESNVFGSGFPTAPIDGYDSENNYVASGWNLNNSARLPGSMLSFESADVSGIVVPCLYIGMCFSSLCWHVEDHHFYSLNYMHWGAPKIWYGVPGRDALKHEAAMRKHLPGLFDKQPNVLYKLGSQLSPSTLKLEGVPVYRCVQHSGEFIVTFPRAYHSGFSCGFNCVEAVNVAPIDWLPHGQNFVEIYCDQRHNISVSHDKLLLGAANEAARAQWNILFRQALSSVSLPWKDACGPDKILAKAFKSRLVLERLRREFLCSSQSRKMDAGFDSANDRKCFFCHYDLYLSASSCSCSLQNFACLNHAEKICSCDWRSRIFLLRHDINELDVLSDALCGKPRAIYRWGFSHLGLNPSSYVKKDKSYGHNVASYSSLEKKLEKLKSSLSALSTSTKLTSETEILKGEAQTDSLVVTRPLNKDGITNQRLQIVEECSSLSSKSLGHADSQRFGQDGFGSTPEIGSYKKQNLDGRLPEATQSNPSTNLNEAEKLISVARADRVRSYNEESRASIQMMKDSCLNDCIKRPKLITSDRKAIEKIDEYHLCSEYWKSRSQNSTGDLVSSAWEEHGSQDTSVHGSAAVLQGLMLKANLKELQALHAILTSDKTSSIEEVVQLVFDEIGKRSV